MTKNRLTSALRITSAIAGKDIVEALRNKNAVSLLISTMLIVLLYRFLPLITTQAESPVLLVTDPRETNLSVLLENSTVLEARVYATEAPMWERLAHEDSPALAIIVPDDFEQALSAGQTPTLKGYVLHWVTGEQARELVVLAEGEVAALLGTPVPIELSDTRIYPTPESGGLGVTLGMAFVYVVLMIGMVATPHLMLEEKMAKTLDALLVSPATPTQIVLGKALAGFAYACLGGAVAWVAFAPAVIHWWLAIAVTLLWSLFAVGLGLVLGTVLEVRQQLALWAWVLVIPLFLPMLAYLLGDLLPDAVVDIVRWVPSSVTLDLVRAAAAGTITAGDWLGRLALSVVYALGALSVEIWALRRSRRRQV